MHAIPRRFAAAFAALHLLAASLARSEVVFETGNDAGFFTPFNAGNAATVRYGDSGWIGSGPGSPGVTLGKITLRLATFGSITPGTTDIQFTLNDGDPSGLVFGSGATLYSTTVTGVVLPGAFGSEPSYFDLEIPLPNVQTLGNFNNVGWSVKCRNYSYGGSFGFQVGTCNVQTVGYYTNNASYFNGSSWSLFAFGANTCTQIAQYSVKIERPACPADFDGDLVVNGGDLGILLGDWGSEGTATDLDGDGTVTGADLGILLGAWGNCP